MRVDVPRVRCRVKPGRARAGNSWELQLQENNGTARRAKMSANAQSHLFGQVLQGGLRPSMRPQGGRRFDDLAGGELLQVTTPGYEWMNDDVTFVYLRPGQVRAWERLVRAFASCWI